MRISDWSSDVCSSDLCPRPHPPGQGTAQAEQFGRLKAELTQAFNAPEGGWAKFMPVRDRWGEAQGGCLPSRPLRLPRTVPSTRNAKGRHSRSIRVRGLFRAPCATTCHLAFFLDGYVRNRAVRNNI